MEAERKKWTNQEAATKNIRAIWLTNFGRTKGRNLGINFIHLAIP
jgi:hypothetical protein